MSAEGEPSSERFLIVNADDFGLTEGVNRGIIETFERGIVTSASLMVRYPAAAAAAEYARAHPRLSVGLHFDIAEWRYRDGGWHAAYQVVDAGDGDAVRAELDRQLEQFYRLMACLPTHLDSHQHIHKSEPARTVLQSHAEDRNVPLRSFASRIKYCGSFYGATSEGEPFPEGISVPHLLRIVQTLSPGWTEFGCHPGYREGLDSVYLAEREEEIRVLCSSEAKQVLSDNRVQLRSFRKLPT